VRDRKSAILHVVLRTGPCEGRFVDDDIVILHNRISDKTGRACLGKAGRRMPATKIERINAAIERSKGVCLIIIRKRGNQFEGFSAPLFHVSTQRDDIKNTLVPTYYRHMMNDISIWFEIGKLTLMSQSALDRLVLLSNERPLFRTLKICRTSLMLVKERPESK